MIDTDKLLGQIDIISLARKLGATMERKGSEWRGKCPIHGGDNETAFQVTTDNGSHGHWRCWTRCDDGGDAISLVMASENLDFIEAIEYLAEYANIDLEDIGMTPEAAQAYEARKLRTDVLNLAARYFAEQLWSEAGRAALEIARGRGFSDDALCMAGWGYSDNGPGLHNYLAEVGADLNLAREIGVIRADNRPFTANGDGAEISPEGWLIYPHRELVGAKRKACEKCQIETWHTNNVCFRHAPDFAHLKSVTYLSARALNPEAEGGDKSRNLPGTGERQIYKAEVPGVREIILVEGPADAESYRQMGYSAWGLCGLGYIPERDLRLLKQRPVVSLAFDADEAGRKKQLELASELGPLTMLTEPISIIKEGTETITFKDANEFYQKKGDPAVIAEMLRNSTPVIEDRLERIKQATPHELQALTIEIVEMLDELPQEVAPRYFTRAQKATGMNRRELKRLIAEMNDSGRKDNKAQVLSEVKDGRLCFLGEPLANFHAKITHEVTIIDGASLPTVRYTVSGILASGETLPPVEVDANDFADMKWVSQYWGARPIVYVSRGKYYLVDRAIKEISLPDMVRERVFTHTGWTTIDDERSYLTSTGRITADGFDDTIQVELEDNLHRFALPEPPTGDDLAAAVKASLGFLELGPLQITAPIWAAIYAAPFTEIYALYTILWLYGSTRSGKSTIAHLALTHFGQNFIRGHQYQAPVDWISTQTHIEEAMFAAKDIPIIIDDFTPQFHSARKAAELQTTASNVVRAVGNRSARGRSKKYQKATQIPRGVVFSTAELPLAGESTVGRMIYIPMARGDILPRKGEPPREELAIAQRQAQAGLYAQAGSAYIQWIARNQERAEKLFVSNIEQSSKFIQDEGILQDRLMDYYGVLNAGQLLPLTAFQEMGILSAHDAAELAEKNRQAILETLVSQDARIAAESPVRKFFEALSNLLERRKVYLAPRKREKGFIAPPDADLIGYFDRDEDGLVYIDDYSGLTHARLFWRSLGENFDTTKDALRRQINQIPGLLGRRDGDRVTATVWTGPDTMNKRLLAIDPEKVLNLFGVVLKNADDMYAIQEQQDLEIK